MNAQHKFLPLPKDIAVQGADDRSTSEETLPISIHWIYAFPDEPGGAGSPAASGEGEEIRDESGLGSGAGVTGSDAVGAEENAEGVDILEGGTDAGGTDFGANMGGPGDTGGIRIEGVTPPGNATAGSNAAPDEEENPNAS